jgi:ABC-type branched-subunit amino acid transport system substrate-binding protein
VAANSGSTPSSVLSFDETFAAVVAPGVTDSEIRVGGIASVANNPVSSKYGTAFQGVEAYFDMVNAAGGIYKRKLVLKDQLDDKLVNNSSEVQRLIGGGDTFAVLPVATLLFTGADQLVKANMPTFGWYINNEWAGSAAEPKANMFGHSGSNPGGGVAQPYFPWTAQQAGKHKLGMLAYNVPQSVSCANGTKDSVAKYGQEADLSLVYEDAALSYGVSDLSTQVSKMKDAGVDIVWTCMDTNAVVTLAREMKKQGLDAIQILPNAYDHQFLDEYGDLFEGSYVRTDFAPYEFEPRSAGMQRFLDQMKAKGQEPTENAIVGWLNADLFVSGLLAAGPNFTQQGLIDAINTKLTAFTADGMLPPINWTTAHTAIVGCFTLSQIKESHFVPAFTTGNSPFICPTEKDGKLINKPAGTT